MDSRLSAFLFFDFWFYSLILKKSTTWPIKKMCADRGVGGAKWDFLIIGHCSWLITQVLKACPEQIYAHAALKLLNLTGGFVC
jgi:hypothetical protein